MWGSAPPRRLKLTDLYRQASNISGSPAACVFICECTSTSYTAFLCILDFLSNQMNYVKNEIE